MPMPPQAPTQVPAQGMIGSRMAARPMQTAAPAATPGQPAVARPSPATMPTGAAPASPQDVERARQAVGVPAQLRPEDMQRTRMPARPTLPAQAAPQAQMAVAGGMRPPGVASTPQTLAQIDAARAKAGMYGAR